MFQKGFITYAYEPWFSALCHSLSVTQQILPIFETRVVLHMHMNPSFLPFRTIFLLHDRFLPMCQTQVLVIKCV